MAAILAALAISRLLAVNLIPVITNDSVGYLSHAQDAFGDGLVWSGYRQFGYPLFLALLNSVSDVIRLEPILFVALVQRIVLAVAIAYLVWLLRWWSIPVVFIVTSPDIVAYTNLVLTEGIAVPAVLLYGALLVHIILCQMSASERQTSGLPHWVRRDSRPSTLPLLFALAAALVAFLTTVKYQSAALVLPLLILLGIAVRGEGPRRASIIVGATISSALLVLSVGMSLENSNEYDDFFPISRGVRNSYWGTYQVVFKLDPANQENQVLAGYYADGNTFAFIRDVESSIANYPGQRAAFEHAIDTLLTESGLDKRNEQIKATWGAIRGGRFNDISGIVTRAIDSSSATVEQTVHSNSLWRDRGIDVYVAAYNDGRQIEPVLTAAAFHSFVDWRAHGMMGWSGPVALVCLLIAAALLRGSRLVFLGVAVSALAILGLTGLLIVDNFRYVVAAHIFVLPLATLAVVLLLHRIEVDVVGTRFRSSHRVNPTNTPSQVLD